MTNTISPRGDLQRQVAERLAAVRIAFEDVVEADHAHLVEQRVDERLGVELGEILGALADADVADRQLQLARDCEDDAALRGAVELGQHDARDAERLVEQPRLLERILALARVEHQQDFVRRALDRRGPSRASPFSVRPSGSTACAGGLRCRRSARRCAVRAPPAARRTRPRRDRRRRPARSRSRRCARPRSAAARRPRRGTCRPRRA